MIIFLQFAKKNKGPHLPQLLNLADEINTCFIKMSYKIMTFNILLNFIMNII